MKAGRPHIVPLSEEATAILRRMESIRQANTDVVFPGSRPGALMSDMTLTMLLRRMGLSATVHGFRSSFRDWASEATSFPREVAEMALAHQVGSKVERSYARSDLLEKRAALMAAWGRFCNGSH
jgi:integrase